MGLLDIFKKQTCDFCGQAVGALSRQKLADGTYICKECQKKCSAFVDLSSFDKADVDAHIEYMARQDKLVKQVFESAEQKRISALHPVFFADDIAMFRVQNDKTSKREYQEVFRYDQIKSYEVVAPKRQDDSMDSKAVYDYMAVKVVFHCDNPKLFLTTPVPDKNMGTKHPWLKEIEIKVAVGVGKGQVASAQSRTRALVKKLDELFGVPVKRSIFSALDSRDKLQISAGVDIMKGLGKAMKSAVKGESANEGLELAQEGLMDLITKNRSKYTRLADGAEQKVA